MNDFLRQEAFRELEEIQANFSKLRLDWIDSWSFDNQDLEDFFMEEKYEDEMEDTVKAIRRS